MFNKGWKITSAVAILALAGFFAGAKTSSAHVLQTDGSIGAVMHIDPEDDPIIGQPATFFFDFKDKQNKFQLSECSCSAEIISNGNQIFNQTLTAADNSQSADSLEQFFSYTFQQKGIYTVEVSGQPKTPGAFQSFNLKYDIRVDRTAGPGANSAAQPQTYNHTWHLISFVIAFPLVYLLVRWLEKRAEKKKKTGQEKSNKNITLKSWIILLGLLTFAGHAALACHGAASAYNSFAAQHQCCFQAPAEPAGKLITVNPIFTAAVKAPEKFYWYSAGIKTELQNKSPPLA